MSRRVLVVGATGRLGSRVVAALGREGGRPRLLVRGTVPPALAGHELVRGDLGTPGTLAAACRGMDVVVSAAGAPIAGPPRPNRRGFDGVDRAGHEHLAEAVRAEGVSKVVYVSVFHDDATAGLPYVRAHVEAERALRAACPATTVVRPTGLQSMFEPLVGLSRFGVVPLPDGGRSRTNPIDDADAAAVVANAIDAGAALVEAGGPDVVTRHEIARMAAAAAGRRVAILPLPGGLLRVAASLARPLDRRTAEAIEFLAAIHRHDVVAPMRGARRLSDRLRRRARGGLA